MLLLSVIMFSILFGNINTMTRMIIEQSVSNYLPVVTIILLKLNIFDGTKLFTNLKKNTNSNFEFFRLFIFFKVNISS